MGKITHGHHKYPLYRIWQHMKNRCYNSDSSHYSCYGGRGISVCNEWLNDPMVFIDWALANSYKTGLTLDRWPNNDGSYEPNNCRWVTRKEQANNTRRLKLFIAYGPESQIEVAKNQRAFARKWGLNRMIVVDCLRKKCKKCKEWTFEYLIPKKEYSNDKQYDHN